MLCTRRKIRSHCISSDECNTAHIASGRNSARHTLQYPSPPATTDARQAACACAARFCAGVSGGERWRPVASSPPWCVIGTAACATASHAAAAASALSAPRPLVSGRGHVQRARCGTSQNPAAPLNGLFGVLRRRGPRNHGGSDRVSNLTLSCEPCNKKKNQQSYHHQCHGP